MSDLLKVELGGGTTPRGEGYLSVDRYSNEPTLHVDLETESLPFGDATVGSLYTSHCLEHIDDIRHVMREIVRVCAEGANVEIRVPHWNGNMAMCHDHKHTITEEQVDHWSNSALTYWWALSPRRLKHLRTIYVPSGRFKEAKGLFPHLTDEQVMRFIPDTCHELRFYFTVIDNGSLACKRAEPVEATA